MHRAALAVLAIAAGTAAAFSAWGDAATKPKPAVVLASDHLPAPLRACEPVTWRFRVSNRARRSARLRFLSGQSADVLLRREDGTIAYRWSDRRGFTQALVQRTLRARATWSFALGDRLSVAPGRYVMVARLTGTSSLRARLVTRRPVTVAGERSCMEESGGRAPPPASVVTPAGEQRLVTGSYCWSSSTLGVCADIGIVPGFMERLPAVVVRPGDLVRFRLDLEPTAVSLAYAPLGVRADFTSLAAAREPTWVVPAGFSSPPPGVLLSLFVRGSTGAGGGDVTYHAALRTPG